MRTIRSFPGANIYSQRPAVVMQLDSSDIEKGKSHQTEGFALRLLEVLPQLNKHSCGSGETDDFIERLNQGLGFNHITEHVAVELMKLAGIEQPNSSACSRNKDATKAVIETTAQETGRFLLPIAAEIVEAVIEGKTPDDIKEKIAEAKRIAVEEDLDANSMLIVQAAEKRGIPWARQDERNLLQFGYGVNLRFVKAALTDSAGLIAVEMANDKDLTRRRLEKFSIPVPDSEIVSDEREATEAFELFGAPVSVKSLGGEAGKSVSLNLQTEEAVVEAFRLAKKHASKISIEEQFAGKNYSILIVGGKTVAAIEQRADGITRDVTNETCASVKNLCERAARVMNLDVCSVELVTEDISAALPRKKAGIVEINPAPDLQMHAFPMEGKPRDVGGAIVEALYPNGRESRIPIISITGTNGKTSVTRMIAHILKGAKLYAGTTTTGGIYLDGELVAKGDMTGPNSARTILGDRAVQAAVLETARGGIVRRGLGYDWSDVGVYTNIAEDHIGQDGIESIKDLINIKALVAERIRAGGTLIINADDENSLVILEREIVRSTHKKIVYFTLNESNSRVREHLANGGTAYFQKDGFIIESIGEENSAIVRSAEIPVTLGGTAEFQVANAMAAIAACRAINVSGEHCASGLQSFRNDANNPGRNNLYKVGRGYVLVDYGHNTDGFAAVCRMARRWTGKTVTGIIGLPGDRENRIVEEAAQVAARGFDRVIVTEEVNRRGREVGEMAKLLCDAIEREKSGACRIILDEIEAFSTALAEMRENEVVVIFYRQLDLILDVLARNEAVPVSSFDESIGAK